MAYDDDIISSIRLRAVDETGDVLRGMSRNIEETTRAFGAMAVAGFGAEGLRRMFMAGAETTRTMEQLKFSTQATTEMMDKFGETFTDVARKTGREQKDLANAFLGFVDQSGLSAEVAIEHFEKLAEASEITGNSIEQWGRVASAALQNMKVPIGELDDLMNKLIVEVPSSMVESFSSVAPKMTQTMNAIGLIRAKNTEEMALAFVKEQQSVGNARQSYAQLNALLGQVGDTSSELGSIMTALAVQNKEAGGDFFTLMQRLDHQLKIMGGEDYMHNINMKSALGLDSSLLKAINAAAGNVDELRGKMISTGDAAKRIGDMTKLIGGDSVSSINLLTASFSEMGQSFSELMVDLGANTVLKYIAGLFRDIGGAAAGVNLILRGHGLTGAVEIEHGIANALLPSFVAPPNTHEYERKATGAAPPPPSTHDVPHLAGGGVVDKETLAVIGEDGPEAVVPLDKVGRSVTPDNTVATKDNTEAVIRLTDLMRRVPRAFGRAFAYTPGAGEAPTPAEAGMNGGGGTFGGGGGSGGWDSNFSGGGGGSFGGGGATGGWGDGDNAPVTEGDTTPPSGNLAAQRAGYMKELDADPHLKAFAIDAMQHEGGVQSNLEQLFNYAAMRHMTIRQALHSGQYGPVNRGLIHGRPPSRASLAALKRVGEGSNITDYATDQGMRGDPNFAKYMANRAHYGMHKVEGAWFSAHGEQGVKWAQRQRAADKAAHNAAAAHSADVSSHGLPHPETSDFQDTKGMAGTGVSHTTPGGVPMNVLPPIEIGPESSLEQHRLMRREMERPIRLSIEAPRSMPQIAGPRRRMARQEQYYQAENSLGRFRQASNVDIGYG